MKGGIFLIWLQGIFHTSLGVMLPLSPHPLSEEEEDTAPDFSNGQVLNRNLSSFKTLVMIYMGQSWL